MKPIFYAANGVADNDNSSVSGTVGLMERVRDAVDSQNPQRTMTVAHIGNAAFVLPASKQGHLRVTSQRLRAEGFVVTEIDLQDCSEQDWVTGGDFDIIYLNGGYPPEARKVFERSGLIDSLPRIRKESVIVACSASAMALGKGSLALSRTIKEASGIHHRYSRRWWWGAGVIRAFVIPHAPKWLKYLVKGAIPDGEYRIQP